jgi:hypothetical protein
VATAGVAAVAALEVVGCGENQVRTFIVEVFRGEFAAAWLFFFFWRRLCVGFDSVRHCSGFVRLPPLPVLLLSNLYCAQGVPPPYCPAISPLLLKV